MSDGKKKGLIIAGVTCGVLLLLTCITVGAGAFMCSGKLMEPANAARAFFGDLQQSNFAGAYGRMGQTYQATHDPAAFETNVRALPPLTTQTGVSFTGTQINNNVATLQGNLSTPQGAIPVTVVLSSVGGTWYVDAVTVQGQMLQ